MSKLTDTNPKVSIVIPTYNHGHLISRCLGALLEQTYKNFEVIVIDNHSTDITDDAIKSFKDQIDLKHYLIQNEGVIAKSRNLGIQKSIGDYIAFLDSDDWWTPEKLELSVSYLKNGADIVYHDLWLCGTKGVPFFRNKAKTRKVKTPIKKDLLLNGNPIANSSVVVRKSILFKTGYLSEDKDLIAGEDFEYWIRIAEISENFVRIPKVLGYYWVGDENTSNPVKTKKINTEILNRYKNYLKNNSKCKNLQPDWMIYSNFKADLQLDGFNKEIFIESILQARLKTGLKIILFGVLFLFKLK